MWFLTQPQTCGPPLWLYLCVKSVGCSPKWPLGPQAQHCAETVPTPHGGELVGAESPRGVRDKMVFITGAPPASLGTWIVPVCRSCALRRAGQPRAFCMVSVTPYQNQTNVLRENKLQANILHPQRKQILSKPFYQMESNDM